MKENSTEMYIFLALFLRKILLSSSNIEYIKNDRSHLSNYRKGLHEKNGSQPQTALLIRKKCTDLFCVNEYFIK